MTKENENREDGGSNREDLEAREYRDKEGNVHHHTKKYMEQHGRSGGSEGERGEDEEK